MKRHPHITDPTPFIFAEAGAFLHTLVKELKLQIETLCFEIHISTKSFYPVINGLDMKIGYYITLLYYLGENKYGSNEREKIKMYLDFIERLITGVKRHFVIDW